MEHGNRMETTSGILLFVDENMGILVLIREEVVFIALNDEDDERTVEAIAPPRREIKLTMYRRTAQSLITKKEQIEIRGPGESGVACSNTVIRIYFI